METIKVEKFVSSEEAHQLPRSIDLLGGWFYDGLRWKDFLETWEESLHPYFEAIREKVLAESIRNGGFWHQEKGCPVFSDGTSATVI